MGSSLERISADSPTATKWDEDATIKRLEKCLTWRRKEEIDDIELISNKVEAEVSRCLSTAVIGI